MTKSARQCCRSAWDGIWDRPCAKPATVERDGKRYCGTHDPERVKARAAKQREKWDAEAARRDLGYRVKDCERDVIEAVIAGTDLTELRTALLDAIQKRDDADNAAGTERHEKTLTSRAASSPSSEGSA